MRDPFARFGKALADLRWLVLVVWLVILGAAGALLTPKASEVAKGGGFDVPGSESAKAAAILEQQFHASTMNNVVVVFHSGNLTIDDPAFQQDVGTATDRLQKVAGVTSVLTALNTADPAFVSPDRHTTTALVAMAGSGSDVEKLVPKLRDQLEGLSVEHYVTGYPAINRDTFTTSEEDLRRSEVFTIPIVLILLLLVFRTVVAAVVPLILGGCSVVLALAAIYLIGQHVETSIFALNVASMIGLGLGIDFSLIMLSRFREERKRHSTTAEAVAMTMATAGRSITYSGITVLVSMAILTLMLRDLMIVRSISMGVLLVAATGLIAGLTLLPAMLAILGHRVEWLRVVPEPRRKGEHESGVWYRLSHAIMRRPWRWLAISVIILLVLALPVRDIAMVGASTGVMPDSAESVKGAKLLNEAFADNRLTPVQIVLKTKEKDGIWKPEFLAALDKLTSEVKVDRRVQEVSSLATVMDSVPRDGRFELLKPDYFTPAPKVDPVTHQPVLSGVVNEPLIEAYLDHIPPAPAFLGLARFTLAPGANTPTRSVPAVEVVRVESGNLTVQSAGKAMLTKAGSIGKPEAAQAIPVNTPVTISPGDQLTIPEGTSIAIRNDQSEPTQFLGVALFVVRPGLQDQQTSWTDGTPSADLFAGLPRKVLGGAVANNLPSNQAVIKVDRATAQPGAFFQRHIHTGPELITVESGTFTVYASPEMTVTTADGQVAEGPFDTPLPLAANGKALVQGFGIHRGRNTGNTPAVFYSTRVMDPTKPQFILVGVEEIADQFVNLEGDNNAAIINIVPKTGEYDKDHQNLVYDLRDTIIPGMPELKNYDVYVGGDAASFLDFRDTLYARFPVIVAVVALLIFFILMMFFQSVFLPIKAMFMNLMSILATYGVLVVIFQYGHGTGLLGFTPQGLLSVVTPAVLYVILFALSTDYEVFMLSRVKELFHETGSNEEAVATGLERTAGVITAAGLILVGTFGSFASARVVTIKEIGLGLAIGVLIDSTIVRVIMVPATMRLMGEKNWWMPAWLKRIVPELREGPAHEPPVAVPQPALAMVSPAGTAVPAMHEAPVVVAAPERPLRPPEPRPRPPRVAQLRVVRGSIGTDRVPLVPMRALTIGRDEQNDLQIFDPRVSRFHARIDYRDGEYYVIDLGSANGTYVDKSRIVAQPERTMLRDGAVIEIGSMGVVVFTFEYRSGS